ncbi:MucBP domain-containing protein [Bacillus sp. Au-Bac7]|uniref:MucBP domain-containing protein n=1 Tax=Bacillus sp. Au-Bac7 TaxID=2906458 RepID=UPI001E463749|nr:MucBP domain-containing protein [Bacillus sp. Au-Bac7]MCE4051693.1 MucBP domain-containing protein [Bacillus sp. Au-Bac7]
MGNKIKKFSYKVLSLFVITTFMLQILEYPMSALAETILNESINIDTRSGKSDDSVVEGEKLEVVKETSSIKAVEDLTGRKYVSGDEPITKPTLEEVVGEDEAKEDIEYLTVNEKGELLYGDEPLYVGAGNEKIPAKLDDLMKEGVKQKLTVASAVKSVVFGKSVSAASAPDIEYRGQISYGGSIVGDFRVNGEQAFCIEHEKPTPGTGALYNEPTPYDNAKVARALYFGWNGPENIFGNDKNRGIVVTSLILSRLYNGDYAGGQSISGYEKLWDLSQNGEIPDDDVSMYREKLTVSFSNGVQKTQTTKFEADKANTLTFKIPDEVTFVNETDNNYTKRGGNVTVSGGDWFYFEAPSDFGGKLDTGSIKGSMKGYQPLISVPRSSGYQTLGYGDWFTDPAQTVRIQAQFEKQEVTMWIDHKDRETGEKILGEKKTVTIGDGYTASSKTGLESDGKKAILDDDKTKKGTVPDKNFTVTFYYTTEWDVYAEYKDYQTGETIRKTDKIGTYKVGDKYSFNARTDITYNDIAYKLRGSAAKSGTTPRKDTTITLYYDPYVWVNVWEKNMYPENDVFHHIKERYKVGTTNTFTAPNMHELSGNRIYDLFGNNTVSIKTPHNNDASHTFDYKLRRSVTVHYLDERTGEEVAKAKTYTIHEKDKYSESPITIKDGEYTLRYVRTDGDSESGTMGTSNLVINYYYDKPLIKTGLEKVQIYTAKAEEGLPVRIYLSNVINYKGDISKIKDYKDTNKTINVSLYQGSTKITEEKYTASTLPEYLEFKIPKDKLAVNENKTYTVKLEGFNPNDFDVIKGKESLETKGYTSFEGTVTFDVNSNAQHEDSKSYVVMTEKTPETTMKSYYETIQYKAKPLGKKRTGYGVETEITFDYTNELGTDYQFATKVAENNLSFFAPESLRDSYLDYPTEDAHIKMDLLNTETSKQQNGDFVRTNAFIFPHVNVEDFTGNLFTDEQVANKNSQIKRELKDGGHKFYTPIWGDLGTYDVSYQSSDVGANKVQIHLKDNLNIFAHFKVHMDSETIEQDAIMFEPINKDDPFPNGIPDDWTEEDVKNLNELLNEELDTGDLSHLFNFGW